MNACFSSFSKKLFTVLAALWLCFFASAPLRAAEGELTVFIWSEYLDPEIVTAFEEQHNIKVRLDYYESNEEMLAKLQSGGLGQYDIIVPSTYFVTSLKKLDLILPLDKTQLTNLKNIAPEFAHNAADPEGGFVVPYLWGTSGFVARTADPASVSWKTFFDPNGEIGNFILFDTARDALGSALMYLGYSLNSVDPKEIEAAARLLIETKKRASFFGFDGGVGGLNKVMGGLAAISQVYSGDALSAQAEDPEVHYILPAEGCEIWMDLLAIPKNAPNAGNAHKFINYMLEPQVAAKLSAFTGYATPNAAAMEFIPEDVRNNPAVYPPAERIEKMEYMQDLGDANRIYDEAWTMVKTQ